MKHLVDMKRPKDEPKGEVPTPMDTDTDRYPWGLRLNLEAEDLEKLSHEGDFRVGDKINITAVAKVKEVRSNEAEGDGKVSRTVALQIVRLALDDTAQLADEFAAKDSDEAAEED